MRVLLVEDDLDQLDIRAQLLQAHGHTVERTQTAIEALKAAETFNPLWIVADLHLAPVPVGGMNGFEMIRALRSACPDSRILVLSGDGFSPEVTEAMRYATGFINKGSSSVPYMLQMMESVEKEEARQEKPRSKPGKTSKRQK